jgi:hypothetical protein
MDPILLVFLTHVFFFWLGWNCRELRAYLWLRKNVSYVEEEEEKDSSQVQIIVDIKDDMIFIYERDTLRYLAHGKDHEGIEKMLMEKFPGKTFAASAQDLLKLSK